MADAEAYTTPEKEMREWPVTKQPKSLDSYFETGDSSSNSTVTFNRSNSWKGFLRKRRPRGEAGGGSDDEEGERNTIDDILSTSCRVAEHAEELVKKVIEAGWNLVHHHALPEWLQDNEHLVEGHRPPNNSFRECFKSIFKIHTETGNIWTHLIGMLVFISVFVYTLNSQYLAFMWQDITVHSVFFSGAILCLGFSWIFHTVFCHSEKVNKLFSKLDYCGIALLTVGSFVPWLYYSFYCRFKTHMIYLVAIVVLGTACIIVSLWDKFSTPRYRTLRAGLFITLGLTGAIPAGHFVLSDGAEHAFQDCGLGWLLLMATLYILGAVIYALRIPERLYPGKFDIWSHQIFHVFVVAAAFVHFRGLQIISSYRLANTQCPGLP